MNSFLQSYGISMENAKSLFRFYVETSFLFLIPYICHHIILRKDMFAIGCKVAFRIVGYCIIIK